MILFLCRPLVPNNMLTSGYIAIIWENKCIWYSDVLLISVLNHDLSCHRRTSTSISAIWVRDHRWHHLTKQWGEMSTGLLRSLLIVCPWKCYVTFCLCCTPEALTRHPYNYFYYHIVSDKYEWERFDKER